MHPLIIRTHPPTHPTRAHARARMHMHAHARTRILALIHTPMHPCTYAHQGYCRFLAKEFAPYFEPWAKNAADFEGLGSYSWNQDPYNVSRANALGFKTNWDLSGVRFFFPLTGS